MDIDFHLTSTEYFANMVDRPSFGINVMFCRGRSSLIVGNKTFVDDQDIIMRVAELLFLLDSITHASFKSGDTIAFTYAYEQLLGARKHGDCIQILDSENKSTVLETISLKNADDLKDKALLFVDNMIAPLSIFSAYMIAARRVL